MSDEGVRAVVLVPKSASHNTGAYRPTSRLQQPGHVSFRLSRVKVVFLNQKSMKYKFVRTLCGINDIGRRYSASIELNVPLIATSSARTGRKSTFRRPEHVYIYT